MFGSRNGSWGAEDLYLVPVTGESKRSVWSKFLQGLISSTTVTLASLQRQSGSYPAEPDERTRSLLAAKEEERAHYLETYEVQLADERALIEAIPHRTVRPESVTSSSSRKN